MHVSIVAVLSTVAALSLVSAQTTTEPITGLGGNASVVENNPAGQNYTAVLPQKPFFNPTNPDGNIKGSISAVASPNGIGVKFVVQFSNLPKSGGPFIYHLHDAPVPADGNCTRTLAHADPYIRGEDPPCNPELPQTCQTGDLSGKYGKIESDPFLATYTDLFASTLPGIGAFFGNRSFVIHYASNKTRITCANFTLVGGSADTIPPPPPPPAPAPPAPYPTVTVVPSNLPIAVASDLPRPSPSPTASSPPVEVSAGAAAVSASLLSLAAAFGLYML